MPAKIVNDNAADLKKRGVLEFFAGKLLQKSRGLPNSVGAGLPAKIVNDNAADLKKRGVLEFFAGKPAPTKKAGDYPIL